MSQLFDVFYKVIDYRVKYSSESNTPFTPAQVIKMAYNAVSSSVIYTDACKDWCRKMSVEKTWMTFKTFFVLDYNQLRESQHISATYAGFHNANRATEDN